MSAQIPPNERVEQEPTQAPTQAPTAHRDNGPMWFGLILILVGGYFLMTTMGIIDNFRLPFDNWWALFFLIPIVATARSAWQSYQNAGQQVTSKVRSQAFGLLFLTVIFSVFLFDLDWGKIWPVFLILLGLMALTQSAIGVVDE